MAYVAIFKPGMPPQRCPLGESNLFGRSSSNDVWVDDANVSRRHCKIVHVDGQWVLSDLSSTNGTWLDAARVLRRYVLRDGETFYIGDARVVFHVDQYIEHRPVDPHEAMELSCVLQMKRAPAESLVANRTARVLPLPRATVAKPGQYRQAKGPRSLAYKRAPAMPIVNGAPANGWLQLVPRGIRALTPRRPATGST